MSSFARTVDRQWGSGNSFADTSEELRDLAEAEAVLLDLASVFADSGASSVLNPLAGRFAENGQQSDADTRAPNLEAKYRALLDQIPAVVFMAYLDRGISEAYVSRQLEAGLGYSREEW